jgi:plasmid maintenance system antidote protein VapI
MSRLTDRNDIANAIEAISAQVNRKVNTPFQEALRLYMRERGVTARGLGASIGVDHTAVSRFINGNDISIKNYTKLLAWFIQKPNYPPSLDDSVQQEASDD